MIWTQQQALEVCFKLEPVIASLGMHIGLTGGCLYKNCPRKDMDIILYRHHGAELATFAQFLEALSAVQIVVMSIHHNVVKMFNSDGQSIDFILRGGVSWPETEACPEGTSDTPKAEKDPDDAKDEAAEQKYLETVFAPIGEEF